VLSAGHGEYQRDTQYYHQLKSAEPGVLFPTFCGSAERIIRNEGRAGFAPLNDLYLHREKFNRTRSIKAKPILILSKHILLLKHIYRFGIFILICFKNIFKNNYFNNNVVNIIEIKYPLISRNKIIGF